MKRFPIIYSLNGHLEGSLKIARRSDTPCVFLVNTQIGVGIRLESN